MRAESRRRLKIGLARVFAPFIPRHVATRLAVRINARCRKFGLRHALQYITMR